MRIRTWGIESIIQGVYACTLAEQELDEFWGRLVGKASSMKRRLVSKGTVTVDAHVGIQQHLDNLEMARGRSSTDGPAGLSDDLRVCALQQQLDDREVAGRGSTDQDGAGAAVCRVIQHRTVVEEKLDGLVVREPGSMTEERRVLGRRRVYGSSVIEQELDEILVAREDSLE